MDLSKSEIPVCPPKPAFPSSFPSQMRAVLCLPQGSGQNHVILVFLPLMHPSSPSANPVICIFKIYLERNYFSELPLLPYGSKTPSSPIRMLATASCLSTWPFCLVCFQDSSQSDPVKHGQIAPLSCPQNSHNFPSHSQ